MNIRQARAHASFLSPYVELLRVASFLREGIRTRATPASNGGFSPGVHLFPFRTESLSPGAPMVLPSPVGESVAANLIYSNALAAFTSRRGILRYDTSRGLHRLVVQ